jgi:zona occludens toxin (predicted ATPase)
VQFNTDNTDIWNNTKLSFFLEMIDFSVSCWLYLRYEKTKIFFPEDFESSASSGIKA